MRADFVTLEVPHVADTAGPSVQVEGMVQKALQVSGTFTAAIDIEISLDGIGFFKIGSTLTGPAIVELPHVARLLRVHTITWASGAPLVTLGGFLARSDV